MAEFYACPGLDLKEPEGWIACYRAGHACEPKVPTTEYSETHRTTSYHCPCCGERGMTLSIPKEWIPNWDQARADAIGRAS